MSDEPPANGNGRWKLLSTLAGGDNVSKVLMFILIALQGGGIFTTKQQGGATREDVDKTRHLVAKQVKVIFDNQRYWIEAVKGMKKDDDTIMQHLGLPERSHIPDPPVKKYPRTYEEIEPEEGEE